MSTVNKENFKNLKNVNFYADLFTNHFARTVVWLLSLTMQIQCKYILPNKNMWCSITYNRDYDEEYINYIYNTIITYLQKYGKIIYVNSKNELEQIINSDKNNYLFHSCDPKSYSNYNNNYIFIHHGFDLFCLNYTDIYQNKYINRKTSIYDYNFKFNDEETKIYNIINNKITKDVANILDINKFNNVLKPILLIIGNSINKIVSFEKFLSNNINDLLKLEKKFTIIIRPHPRCCGIDIYNSLKKLNNNFIVDMNITFITAIDKSDIILSYGLTSIIDNYALWTNKKILLIYEHKVWNKQNHKQLADTNKILNNNCCIIQHEKNVNIISGIDKALNMDLNIMLEHRKIFLNNYFYTEENDGHIKFLKNIFKNRNIIF